MTSKMKTKVDGNVLTIEREFNAPRSLVFQVYSDAEHIKQWWGPRGWEVTACNLDFRPGGVWHYCMKCIDRNQGDFYGMESWGKGIYSAIVQDEKIEYTDYFSDAEGNVPEDMPASDITLIFEEQDGRTKLINIARYVSAEALQTVLDMGMEYGFSETMDRLEEHLESVKG